MTVYYFVLIPTYLVVSQVTVEDRYTHMRERQREGVKQREKRKKERQRNLLTKGTPTKKNLRFDYTQSSTHVFLYVSLV